MPHEFGEKVLRTTKTVTVINRVSVVPTESVRLSENTFSNIASDSGHPVSMKISHMYETKRVSQKDAEVQVLEKTVESEAKDPTTCASNGRTRIEPNHSFQVNQVKSNTFSTDAIYSRQQNNVIDLHFMQPVTSNEMQYSKRQLQPITTASFHTLYYKPCLTNSTQKNVTSGKTIIRCQSPVNDRSFKVDACHDLAPDSSNNLNDSGLIIYNGMRQSEQPFSDHQRQSATNRDRSVHFQTDRTDTTKLPQSCMDSVKDSISDQGKHKYIITSSCQSKDTALPPNIKWICAEVNGGSKPRLQTNSEAAYAVSARMNDGEQAPSTSKSIGKFLIKHSSCTDMKICKDDEISSNISRNSVANTDDAVDSIRNRTIVANNDHELRQSQSVPTISDDQIESHVCTSTTTTNSDTTCSQSAHLSPIVVVNQNRKSLDNAAHENKDRKAGTITDIDWFAAFNMKEPTRPKPHKPSIDVLKGAEITGAQSHSTSSSFKKQHGREVLDESTINLNDIFCTNSEEKSSRKCSCSACNYSKPSDCGSKQQEEHIPKEPKYTTGTCAPQKTAPQSNSTAVVDITLDEVFSQVGTSTEIIKVVSANEDVEEQKSEIRRKIESANNNVLQHNALLFPHKAIETELPPSSDLQSNNNHNTIHLLPQQKGKHHSESSKSTEDDRVVITSSDYEPITRQIFGQYPRNHENKLSPNSLRTESDLHNYETQHEALQLNGRDGAGESSSGENLLGEDNGGKVLSSIGSDSTPIRPARSKAAHAEGEKTCILNSASAVTIANADKITESGEGNSVGKPRTLLYSNPVVTQKQNSANRSNRTAVSATAVSEIKYEGDTVKTEKKVSSTPVDNGDNVRKNTCNASETSKNVEDKDEKHKSESVSEKSVEGSSGLSAIPDHHNTQQQTEEDRDPSSHNTLSPLNITSNLDEIHFPNGRTTLIGDILRRPSILEETPFNTVHLSPKNDVSKAYHQRLSHLKLELDMDSQNAEKTSSLSSQSCDESACLKKTKCCFSDPETTHHRILDSGSKSIDDEVVNKFNQVIDAKIDLRSSAGKISSTKIQDLEEQHVRENVVKRTEQPLNDTIFNAPTLPREKLSFNNERSSIDTLCSKKSLEQIDSTKLKEAEEEQARNSDVIMNTVFTSSINNQQLMESVIPLSQENPHSNALAISIPRLSGISESDSCLDSHSNVSSNIDGNVTYISNASVTMNNTHSSSDGEFSDDHIMKLVFPEPIQKSKSELNGTKPSKEEVAVEESTHTPNSSIHCQTNSRSASPMDNDYMKTDAEILEVEVLSNHFHIKGSFSIFINKEDEPLGKLYEDLYSKRKDSLDFSFIPKLRRLLFECLQEKAFSTTQALLSSRARNLLTDDDLSDLLYSDMSRNRYNGDTNPQGIVNFCTAENNVCMDEVMSYMKMHALSSISTNIYHYPVAGGYPSTKRAVCKYMAEFMQANVEEDELVILPSTTSAYDMLTHCICEADDIVLTSSPTYTAVMRNLNTRAKCQLRTVEMDMVTPKLELKNYQRALDMYHSKGETVRALLIINPHNPLGVVFPPEEVIQLCNWATRNNLVVLIDESFASCVFGTSSFKSFLCYRHQLQKPSDVTYMWSLSKDFGLPGLKMSVVQTKSSELMMALSRLELIYPVSALAQDFASVLLTDLDWLRKFHAIKLARMSAHYEFLTKQLRDIGLNFTSAVAGCFIMIDLRKFLRSQTFAEESSMFQSLCDRGLMLTPGQHVLASQPGWMRIVFTCNKRELVEGINRLRAFFNFPAVNDTIDY